jgi:hypothetical protein
VSEYFEISPQPTGGFDAVGVVDACIESGTDRLLLDDGALPPEFFDLSTGVAGAMVQRLTQYEIRMAGVVPDPSAHSRSFHDLPARRTRAGRGSASFPTASRRWSGFPARDVYMNRPGGQKTRTQRRIESPLRPLFFLCASA